MRNLIVGAKLAAACTMFSCAAAGADETAWSCRNSDFEISCDDGACRLATKGSFTPMDVSFRSGHLSVCAYTGCWTGTPLILDSGDKVYVEGNDLQWSHGEQAAAASFQIALDKQTKSSVLMGMGYAHPMHCRRTESTE